MKSVQAHSVSDCAPISSALFTFSEWNWEVEGRCESRLGEGLNRTPVMSCEKENFHFHIPMH